MMDTSKARAEYASFQAFVNCYIREIDSGVWHPSNRWQLRTGVRLQQNEPYVIELLLSELNLSLAIGVHYQSAVGRHTLTSVFQKSDHEMHWISLDYFSTILLLIHEMYADPNLQQTQHLELMARTIDSHQVMQRYLAERQQDPSLYENSFIASEQSLLFGHWFHPTPKSRQGILDWQHSNYTPELRGRFPLHYFAIDRKLVRQNSTLSIPAEEIVLDMVRCGAQQPAQRAALQALNQEKVLVPTHPIQAHWLLHQPQVKQLIAERRIVNVGQMGASFTATSSVRTLYNEMSPYMLKFSLPVKITNSLRLTRSHELEAGVVIAKLMQSIDFESNYPQFKTIHDPAYLTVELEGMENSGFEVILRQNPFQITPENRANPANVQSIAALVQEPVTENGESRLQTLVYRVANTHKISITEASLSWFEHYWHCAIEPALKLYDQFGIALEAHQQNSLLDISTDLPTQYYYRDNQGYYLSSRNRAQLVALEPSIQNTPELFFEDAMIQNRFTYYLFVNQLFAVINRFGVDQLVRESVLIKLCRKKLLRLQAQAKPSAHTLIQQLLFNATLPCKGNLLTRINDIDELQAEKELAVYTEISNPFYTDQSDALTISTQPSTREANLDFA